MKIKEFFKNKTIRKILIFTVLILCASTLYFIDLFVFYPERQLSNILNDFDQAVRKKDTTVLKLLVSEKCVFYPYLASDDIQKPFILFEPGIEVEKALYAPNRFNSGDSDWIWGSAKMKAKIDGEYRYFSEICLVKEDGERKIRQFSFPDLIDY
ncbi:MAG: hypothetical protein WC799_12490 [Desulfobacteraceae bacterium]